MKRIFGTKQTVIYFITIYILKTDVRDLTKWYFIHLLVVNCNVAWNLISYNGWHANYDARLFESEINNKISCESSHCINKSKKGKIHFAQIDFKLFYNQSYSRDPRNISFES